MAITVWDVWRWYAERNSRTAEFRRCYRESLKAAINALLVSCYREDKWAICSLEREDSRTQFAFGSTEFILCDVEEYLPFEEIGLSTDFEFRTAFGSQRIATLSSFERAFRAAVAASSLEIHADQLLADFSNSFANLVLNRLLYALSPDREAAIEPAFRGHHYFPFPALRVGPDVRMVTEFSHVSGHYCDVPVFRLEKAVFRSVEYEDEPSARSDWSGGAVGRDEGACLLVHPWQVRLSPVVQTLIEGGQLVPVAVMKGMPLASQRTVRLLDSGYDVKLPLNATITGEHRLIYARNLEYSQLVTTIVRKSLGRQDPGLLGIQPDVMTLRHSHELLGQHVCMIIRRPATSRNGRRILPAINLFGSPDQFVKFINDLGAIPGDFIHDYIRIVISGSLYAFGRLRLALEPHLQNSLVELDGQRPDKLIIRDLDSVILDRRFNYSSLLGDRGLPCTDLSAMPPFVEGARRLAFSMLRGHLAQAMLCARTGFGIPIALCMDAVRSSLAQARDRDDRGDLDEFFRIGIPVKMMLTSRLARDMQVRWEEEF